MVLGRSMTSPHLAVSFFLHNAGNPEYTQESKTLKAYRWFILLDFDYVNDRKICFLLY